MKFNFRKLKLLLVTKKDCYYYDAELWLLQHRPGHNRNINVSSSWLMEKPEEVPRAKRIVIKGPSEDTPDIAVVQVLYTGAITF